MGRPRSAPDETTPSIYKGYDGLWHARVAMRIKADGSVERKHVRRKDRGELVKVVRGLERSRDNGSYAWTEDDPTLTEWIEHWLSAILSMSARPKTLATYRSQMVRHLLPALGHYRLSELRPEHLESLYVSLQHDGASVPTIRAVHRVLRSALNEAVRRRRLLHNPAQVARPPRLVEKEIEPLTVDECRRVLAVAATRRNGPRWSIALSLGLRQGEALGLLSDVDLDDGTLSVRRSAQRLNWKHGCPPGPDGPSCGRKRAGSCPRRRDGGLMLVEPKTKASRRTIVLPQPLRDGLRAHRAVQARERLAAGPAWIGVHDLVFATEWGQIIDPGNDGQSWRRLLDTAGVRRVRVHDARHTAATLLLLEETDLRTVMAIMGWTELATAQRYTHAVDELRSRAAARMGSLL